MRVPIRVAASLRTRCFDLRIRCDVDIWGVVCVRSKNEDGPGTEAHDIMEERDGQYDTMAFADAMARALLAPQRLRNADLNDVGRGADDVGDEDSNSRFSIENDAAAVVASVGDDDVSMGGLYGADTVLEHGAQ
jgi:hypothetical protein